MQLFPRNRRARALLVCGALLLGEVVVAGSAGAEGAVDPELSVSQVVEVVESVAAPVPPSAADGHGSLVAGIPGGAADVPLEGDSMAIAADGGPTVELGLPVEEGADAAATPVGVVAEGAGDDVAVVARPTSEGVQALVVIDGPAAPIRYEFPVTVDGRAATLRAGAAGGVDVLAPDGGVVATVTPPWAIGADGEIVPTRFVIEGTTLVQEVDHHGAAYPVTADPNTCGWVTCTYYFGKLATEDLSAADKAAIGCPLLVKVPVAAVGCAAVWVAVSIQADRARRRGMCLKIKYTKSWPTVWYPDIYRGGYCK